MGGLRSLFFGKDGMGASEDQHKNKIKDFKGLGSTEISDCSQE
jgi:hypothetical protein